MPLGSTASVSFTIQNVSGASLPISQVTPKYNGSNASATITTSNCTNTTLANNASCTETIQFSGSTVGTDSFNLWVYAFNGSIGSKASVNVSVVSSGYAISGTLSGLTASGLVLQNNAGDDLSVSSGAGSFQFLTPVASGGSYVVTVKTQPTGQTCTVSNASGSNVTSTVSNVSITCSTNTYTIGGSISGLSASGLVLQNNSSDDLSVSSGASSFQFVTPVAHGGGYSVTVKTQPTGQTCTVSNASGSNVTANISEASVSCISSNSLVYIANRLSNKVAHCDYNSSTGAFSNCSDTGGTGFSYPFQLVLNSTGTIAFVVNISSHKVSRCDVNTSTGAFSNCSDTGANGLSSPHKMVLNSTRTMAFITNWGGDIRRCDVNTSTGAFSSCSTVATGFSNPVGITLNATGTTAFITNFSGYVSRCDVNTSTGAFSNCSNTGGAGLNQPAAISLNPTGTMAFITDWSGYVRRCDVNTSTGAFSNCSSTGGTGFTQPAGVSLNSTGTMAFISNQGSDIVSRCDVNTSTGAFSNCSNTGAVYSSLSGPSSTASLAFL